MAILLQDIRYGLRALLRQARFCNDRGGSEPSLVRAWLRLTSTWT
jgi:hypothetical protein